MLLKRRILAGIFAFASLATVTAVASAAETGTKTFPGSSVYPPATPQPLYDFGGHYECYLPSEPCDDQHRVDN